MAMLSATLRRAAVKGNQGVADPADGEAPIRPTLMAAQGSPQTSEVDPDIARLKAAHDELRFAGPGRTGDRLHRHGLGDVLQTLEVRGPRECEVPQREQGQGDLARCSLTVRIADELARLPDGRDTRAGDVPASVRCRRRSRR